MPCPICGARTLIQDEFGCVCGCVDSPIAGGDRVIFSSLVLFACVLIGGIIAAGAALGIVK